MYENNTDLKITINQEFREKKRLIDSEHEHIKYVKQLEKSVTAKVTKKIVCGSECKPLIVRSEYEVKPND
jgi:hypothetical protein